MTLTSNRPIFSVVTLMILSVLLLYSCGKNDESSLTISFSGLEGLGSNYTYEGWLIIDGVAKSTGVFNIDTEGKPFPSSFDFDEREIQKATSYIVTIEPNPDPDPAASDLHVIAGDFNGSTAQLTVSNSSAIEVDFESATGSYILATPTDNVDTNFASGVWFTAPDSTNGVSLKLPNLPSNWIYEGWAVIDEIPVSLGTFRKVDSMDLSNFYSGVEKGFDYPGEDLIQNAPDGLSFPTNLATQTIAISVEPIPDNSNEPFSIKPLISIVDSTVIESTSYPMGNNSDALPSGTATR